MSERHYNWKRFWCPPDGSFNLSDGGYPCDPEAEWSLQHSAVVPFESIADVRCLGLLGEPGMGKSWEMRLQYESARQQAEISGDCALWFDLRTYQTDVRLHAAIFEDPEVVAWQSGTHQRRR